MGVTGSNPVSRTIILGDFTLNPQDISTIQDIWAHGCSISEIWKAHKTQQQLVDVSLAQAISQYLTHLRELKRSPRYIQETGWVLSQYKAAMPPNLPLKLHTTCAGWEAIKNWRSLPTKKSRLRSFYAWAHRRGYIAKPIEFDAVRTPPSAPIGILTNYEVGSMLEHSGSLLGHLWLSLCLGLRVDEATRFKYLECRDDYLIVGDKASKTRSRRVIALPKGHKERYWPLVRPELNLKRRIESLRQQAGILTWPRNCMRHTAASHWLNHYQDEAKAALHLGHSPTMLHRHYKALVTRKKSEEFFALWEQAR